MAGPYDQFTTARLTAERLTPEHLPDLLRMNQDEKFSAMIGGLRDEAQTRERMVTALSHWDEHGYGVWIVRERRSGRIAGRAVLRHLEVDGVDELEVGYAFYEEYWGRGLGTEIAAACVALGREQLGRSSFVALTDPRNRASQHVLEKVGFRAAGTFTQDGEELNLFRARWPVNAGAAPGPGA